MINQLYKGGKYEGTKVRGDEGTRGRRYEGTKVQGDEGTNHLMLNACNELL